MAQTLEQLSPSTSTDDPNNEFTKSEEGAEELPGIISEPHSFRHYRPLFCLGKGGFAHCYAALASPSLLEVALKIVPRSLLKKHSRMVKMRNEIAIHESLNHPNVVKFFSHFEDNINVCMVLELCRYGSLLSRIQNAPCGRLRDHNARLYFLQIVEAVSYLHGVGILHRDLKPGNVLLSDVDKVKLADFGLAIKVSDLPYSSLSICGTPNYLSPEVLKREGHSKESEAWSLGCMLFCMLVGKPPFETESLAKTYARISSCDFSFPLQLKINSLAVDLISKLLVLDAAKRMKIDAIMDHAYFGNNKDTTKLRELFLAHGKENDPLQSSKEMNVNLSSGHRYSIGGSGIGSEGCSNVRSRSLSYCIALYKQLLLGYYTVLDEIPRSSDFRLNMVSKWVDYTNKYGFGCVLSDSTHCTLFIDNSSISRRRIADFATDRYLLISDTTQEPWSISEWTTLDLIKDQQLAKKVRLAGLFSDYMDRELHPVYEHNGLRHQLDALIYQKRQSGMLLMFLASGTIQINFLESHEKLVISQDKHSRLLLTVIDGSVGFRIFQLVLCASKPVRSEYRRIQHLLSKACILLEDGQVSSQQAYCGTEC
ncbi:unnamed protein product [Thelazia callipaeda]|uniref:Serine/threonine-protein kinase PLK n=1 Tax=Thelazia callipaeda TaxID=103827 RepID=A0A0N5CQW6_THECL|nr:unnamed protein product [Thelazia callipaeda]